jgi:two-component system, cell cycle response regulator CpdR
VWAWRMWEYVLRKVEDVSGFSYVPLLLRCKACKVPHYRELIVARQEPPSPFRVLYVEDVALVREITRELLARDGWEIVAVGSGEEALGALNGNRFDVVVTDISLPAMSGVDLARKLEQLLPSIPVLLASGYNLDLDDMRLGPKVRAIKKPFDKKQLDALIRELCGSSSA